MHMWIMHDEGHFRCPHEPCTFEASYRKQVYNHIDHRHQVQKFQCPFDGCDKAYTTKNELKAHERRIHLLLKPYRCKWPGCTYSSEVCPAVIRHIRTQHFHLPETMRKQREKNIVDFRDPKEYLEVICDPNKVYAVLTPANANQLPVKHCCTYDGCGKSFLRSANLKIHQREHLGLKPFRCKWSSCEFGSERRETVIQHIRVEHFKLPRSLKEQRNRNIQEGRNPKDYIEVITDQFDDPQTKALVAAMAAATTTSLSVKNASANRSVMLDHNRTSSSLPLQPQTLTATTNSMEIDDVINITNNNNITNNLTTINTNRPKRGRPRGSTNKTSASVRKNQNISSSTLNSDGGVKSKPRHICQHPGCGKEFRRPANLKDHQRIHLGLKPFQCTFGTCQFASGRKENVLQHVRTSHFNLPRSMKEQKIKNIEDYRDPNDYIQTVHELLN